MSVARFSILAASLAMVAAPALAQPPGEREPGRDRGGRGGEVGATTPAPATPDGARAGWRGGDGRGWNRDGSRPNPRGDLNRDGRDWAGRDRDSDRRDWNGRDRDGDRRDWNDRDRGRGDGDRGGARWNDRDRNGGNWDGRDRSSRGWDGRSWDGRGWDGRGLNGGGWNRGGWDNRGGRWNDGWRTDRRYDWRDWRNRNHGLFRGPRYVDPRGYGYGYRPFTRGYRIDPYFYSSGYWLNDPYSYHLPPAYGPYRWVRYYNDVLLVDVTSGIVADLIQSFFW